MDLLKLKSTIISAIEFCNSVSDLIEVKNEHLSKKSPINSLMGLIKTIPAEEKATYGQKVNELKNDVNNAYEEKMKALSALELAKKLESEQIDISLPGKFNGKGSINPCFLIEQEIVSIFLGLGYSVVEGRDIENDHYNFEMMNIEKDHPAREMQDTFYISESLLMRTHTSPAQAHAMERSAGKPLKIICPGKCFRRDDDDLTHSHQFGQIEGLLIDKNVSIADLKGTLEIFLKKLFGEKREIRLRSSYFPFTEPSVEVDVSCSECGGKGCNTCKGTGYIEILGAGIVNPRVLELNGYDPNEYSGFAFGVGIERLAMLRYGIDDIRRLFINDKRFVKQFNDK